MRSALPAKVVAFVLAIAIAGALGAQPQEAAELMPLAHRSLLLDVTLAGDRAVAVGERAHILLSDDYGQQWQQVEVPTRATLTAVHFADNLNGWAVGHDNIILMTSDGGQNWQHQYPAGGPDNHFLDVLFLDAENGIVVGAYGMALRTRDGGKSWQMLDVTDEDLHLNRIHVLADGSLMVAAEAGSLFRSVDDGETWDWMESPYEGSLFGTLSLTSRTLLIYGLRGHVFRSTDGGQRWAESPAPMPVLITDAVRTAGGALVFAGQGEHFFISHDAGRTLEHWEVPVQGASALQEMPDGAIVAVGLNGVFRLALPRLRSGGPSK